MPVREHNSQHDYAESLPVVSKSAKVVAVDAMDRDRRSEIRQKLFRLGNKYGFRDAIPEEGPIDWDLIFEAATRENRRLAPQIGAFRERFERAFPSLVRIAFETKESIEFAAGQYVSIRYGNRTRAYSIASSPNRATIELCVRRVPGGKLSSRLAEELSVGDTITVRGPNGDLLLQEPSERDMAFLATGTGVAPLKSMIDYTFEEGRDAFDGETRDVWLFLGAAWEDDLPYHTAFCDLAAERDNFHYVPCLSREPWLSAWEGETEYIQDAMLKYVNEQTLRDAAFGGHMAEMLYDRPTVDVDAHLNPRELEVYACGINAMVYGLETTAQRLGVPKQNIYCEGYG